ncbi:MerR family transcriptional regulator [Microbacterium plantarum]|uniref:hypothetical protein n=1 Tax=Microbacterium plantarum TaxID=1816425 RepID=UPI002B48EF03|nr:hypothetical protein [Microbacterium plantarum]WRK16542.1 hypothetical protein VC184_11550 [Microbacterium plantarum]
MTSKLAYSIPDLAEAVGLSVSSIRDAIDRGDLRPKYPNRKPIIPAGEAERWIASLPEEKPERVA